MPLTTPPDTRPAISVIVLAHRRREFLREAIESVLRQDLDRGRFEIVVVKNFRDAGLDEFIERVGAQHLESEAEGGSPKLKLGIERSRGRILTFLEDDDAYEPSRLRRIYEAFEKRPGLGYYHNGLLPVDVEGRPLRGFQARVFRPRGASDGRSVLLEDDAKITRSSVLVGQLAEFNISASAVHRRVIEPAIPYLARMFLCADSLIFFAALASNASLLLETDPLTRYRVHGQNVSLGGTGGPDMRVKRLYDFAVQSEDDYQIVREFVLHANSDRCLSVIDARIWVNRLEIAFRSENSRRRDFARLLLEVPRFSQTYVIRENWQSVAGTGIFLFSPAWGRRLYQLYRSRI